MLIHLYYMMIFRHFMLIVLTLHDTCNASFKRVYAETLSLHMDHHIHGMKINNYNINSNNIKEFTCSIHLIIAFQSQMKVHCRRTSVPYCGGGGGLKIICHVTL